MCYQTEPGFGESVAVESMKKGIWQWPLKECPIASYDFLYLIIITHKKDNELKLYNFVII